LKGLAWRPALAVGSPRPPPGDDRPMSVARRGPVLAYSHPGTAPALSAGGRSDLDRLLSSHGFVLERGTQAATGAAVLRLVDRTTGRVPVRVPAELVAALAASIAGTPYPTLASA